MDKSRSILAPEVDKIFFTFFKFIDFSCYGSYGCFKLIRLFSFFVLFFLSKILILSFNLLGLYFTIELNLPRFARYFRLEAFFCNELIKL